MYLNIKAKIESILFILKEKLEILRFKVATNPKIIIFRLRLFAINPFLGNNFIKIISGFLIFLFVFILFYFSLFKAPSDFKQDTLVSVKSGDSLREIARNFENNNVVKSSFFLQFLIIIYGGEKGVIAGDYYFPTSKNVFGVANMLHRGKFGLIPLRTTIFEGSSSRDIADMLSKTLPYFDSKEFLKKVDEENLEGFLFPDTYFFMQNTRADDVILMMRENFARAIKPYENDLIKFKKSLEDVVIMASIIEGEARGLESKRIVSGILWKRLKIGMPLQVDAVFKYYNGKNSYTLTKDDLKSDHSYNTYTNKGLPPTAINNPGVDSFRASITPTNTGYLYFLSDKSGNMYYAKTFEEHKRNKERYLR